MLARYASPEQQQKWLIPLLNGEIRSAFSMTERFGMSSLIIATRHSAYLPPSSRLV